MEPIRVGIIGFGRSGCGIHADNIAAMTEKKFTVVAICDELPERRTHESFPEAKPYATAEELLMDPAVEMVVVATYNYTHAKYARMALEAGNHVLCEKPFGYTAADVDSMIAAAKKAGKVLQPFQQRRFEPDFLKIREILDSGILGTIKTVRITWAGFSRRWDWQTMRVRGGGQLYNNGPHLFDYGLVLLGEKDPKVFCRMRNAMASGDAEDEFNVVLQAEDAPEVELIISASSALPDDRWLICGTQGTLRGSGTHLEWKYLDWKDYPARPVDMHPLEGRKYCGEKLEFKTGSWDMEAAKSDAGAGAKPASGPAQKLYETLYQAIRCGKPQAITPEEVRRRIAVMAECYRQNNVPFPENTIL